MYFAVERQGRGPIHLWVLIFGDEGDMVRRMERDFYVFARSPLFRRGCCFLFFFVIEVLATSPTGQLVQCVAGNGAFVMQGGL